MAVRIVKKNKNNLPICLRYGYVLSYGLAKRLKLEYRRQKPIKKAAIAAVTLAGCGVEPRSQARTCLSREIKI